MLIFREQRHLDQHRLKRAKQLGGKKLKSRERLQAPHCKKAGQEPAFPPTPWRNKPDVQEPSVNPWSFVETAYCDGRIVL